MEAFTQVLESWFSFSPLCVSADVKYTTFGGADPQNPIQGQLRQVHRERARLPLRQVEAEASRQGVHVDRERCFLFSVMKLTAKASLNLYDTM